MEELERDATFIARRSACDERRPMNSGSARRKVVRVSQIELAT